MLVGSPQRSFISTLQRINLANFFRYSFGDPPSSRVEGMRFFCNVGMLILDKKKTPIFTPQPQIRFTDFALRFIRRLRGGLARHPFGGFTSNPYGGFDLKFTRESFLPQKINSVDETLIVQIELII